MGMDTYNCSPLQIHEKPFPTETAWKSETGKEPSKYHPRVTEQARTIQHRCSKQPNILKSTLIADIAMEVPFKQYNVWNMHPLKFDTELLFSHFANFQQAQMKPSSHQYKPFSIGGFEKGDT